MAAAADIDAFYQALVPEPCTDATLLVLSTDGKGVVIRPEALREATAKAAAAKSGNKMATRLAPGEKSGRKRMATLGTVYDAEPVVRGVDGIIADPADPAGPAKERRPGPKARSKWLCGSVNDTAEQVIAAVFDQAEARDPEHRRTWVVLVPDVGTVFCLFRPHSAGFELPNGNQVGPTTRRGSTSSGRVRGRPTDGELSARGASPCSRSPRSPAPRRSALNLDPPGLSRVLWIER
ncbi:hypothetical protein ABZV67_45500 [Streptomyces sp. NPDC005065]|uniref:hypothetical protein n=1 Tax=Streptomyces sp. NPDC005065 TaxID=3154461 RepID=UPI0033BE5019